MVENQYGKTSSLILNVISKDDRTYLNHAEFTAPFKVLNPFYIRKDECELMQLMLISVSAGLMAGDVQDISIQTRPGSLSEFTTQSYEKIHKMPAGQAIRNTHLLIGSHSFCHYKPLPMIPFAESSFASETTVELEDDSSVLVYREVLSGGRQAYSENFAYKSFRNKVTIRMQGHLLYYDNTIMEPQVMDMSGYGMWEGYTHMGNLIFCNLPFESERVKEIRQLFADEKICGGISQMDGALVLVRIFGMRADEIIRCFDKIYEGTKIGIRSTG